MVSSVVNSVDSNGVEAKLLEVLNVSLAAIGIGNGVCDIRRATRLIVDTSNVKSFAAGEEC